MEFVVRDTVGFIILMSQGARIFNLPMYVPFIEVSVMANLSSTPTERQKEDSREAALYTAGCTEM